MDKLVTFSILFFALGSVCLAAEKKYDPCCSFPCQHRGVCMSYGYDKYVCDCSGLDYYGTNCETPTLMKSIKLMITPSPETITSWRLKWRWMWQLIDYFPSVKGTILKFIFLAKWDQMDSPPLYGADGSDYVTMEASVNKSLFARILPPVPKNCPTPMGVAGPKVLPPAKEVAEKIFKRKEFIPDPVGTSVTLAYWAQHFTHQFFKTDFKKGPGMTWGSQEVDISHVYGHTKEIQAMLRTHKDGKMKMQVINGEEYPPYLKDAPVGTYYPEGTPEHQKFALGHFFFGLLPGLMLYSTMWLREHNRVCDILKDEHPTWDDEHLYQTAKMVILGETMKLVVNDYINAEGNTYFGLDFDPTILFGTPWQYANRVFIEHNHVYHWHQLMPDAFVIDGKTYEWDEFVYHSEILVEHGTSKFIDSFSRMQAGQPTIHNHGKYVLEVAQMALEHGRELRFQSLNNYRRRLEMRPYEKFEEITESKEDAKLLEEIYGDVEAVELFVGVMAERRRYKGVFGPLMYELAGVYSLKAVMSSPICSPSYWKPSTFGGETGFKLVNEFSLKKLFCNNMPGPCPYVSFRIPESTPENNMEPTPDPKAKTEL